MTSFQEAPTNESIVEIDENEAVKGQLVDTKGAIVEIDENEEVKGQLVDTKGASTPPGTFKFLLKVNNPRSKI